MNKAQIRQLIAENRLEEAIGELLSLTEVTHLYQEALMLSARLAAVNSQRIIGSESPDEIERRRNEIAYALLKLLEDLPEGTTVTVSVSKNSKGEPASETDVLKAPSHPSQKMPFWFSMAAFVVLLAISLFVPGWAHQNNALFKTLLALAAAGVAATLPGFLNFEINNFIKAGGALAAFVLVFLVNPAKEDGPFALAVQVRASTPSANYPPLKDAELEIWNKNEWLKGKFSEEGVADFKNLSPELIGKYVPVRWKAEYYRPAKDSLLVAPPAVVFDFVPDGSLERVFGKVSDPRGQAFPGVAIEVEGRFDTTDAAGNYNLRIPSDLQKTHYLLHATAKGFQPALHEVWPASGALDFSMKK